MVAKMENNQVIVISPYQLSELIKESITEALSGLKKEDAPEDKLMNSAQVCEYLGIAESTLSKYKRTGVIPFVRFGKSVRFDRAKIDEYLRTK